jgi:hypothetical protein
MAQDDALTRRLQLPPRRASKKKLTKKFTDKKKKKRKRQVAECIPFGIILPRRQLELWGRLLLLPATALVAVRQLEPEFPLPSVALVRAASPARGDSSASASLLWRPPPDPWHRCRRAIPFLPVCRAVE